MMKTKKSKKKTIKGILVLLKSMWVADKKLTIIMILNNILRSLVLPLKALVVKGILDIINNSISFGILESFKNRFIYLGILFLFIFLINRIWWPINSYIQNMALSKISNEVKRKIMVTVSEYRLEFFDSKENYDSIALAKEQVNGRRAIVIINNIINLISAVITLIISSIPMIGYSYILLVILIVSSMPRLFLQKKFSNALYKFQKETTTITRQIDYTFSLFSNKQVLKEIKYLDIANYFNNKYDFLYKDYIYKNNKLAIKHFFIDFPFWFITQFAIILSYFFFIKDASLLLITIGEAGYFISIASSLTNSFFSIGTSFNSTIESGMYGNNLLSLYNNNTIEEKNGIDKINLNTGEIVFDNVSFTYPDGTPVLYNINFKMELKKIYSIVGLNGSGKSTIIKLLLRLYNPTSGAIYFNDININEININVWWEHFSVCFQDYVNYDLTLAECISMNDQIVYNKLEKHIETLDLNDVIKKLPNGYDTYLSKKFHKDGIELSVGQQSKVALAKALYKNGDIIILDEPTASLDAFAEADLFQKMLEFTKEKTGVFISHRLSSSKQANRIFVFKDGRLIEEGIHSDLYNKKGYYYELFQLQAQKYKVNSYEK